MGYKRISQEKIDKILELGGQGLPRQDIAEEVRVSGGTVSKYLGKATRSEKRPEGEGSAEIVALLKETLEILQEQKRVRAVLCPVCGFSMYPLLTENGEIPWGCPRCGYRLVSPEPRWRREEEVEEIKLEEV